MNFRSRIASASFPKRMDHRRPVFSERLVSLQNHIFGTQVRYVSFVIVPGELLALQRLAGRPFYFCLYLLRVFQGTVIETLIGRTSYNPMECWEF